MRDWNYQHQTAGVENAGPSSYGKPKHLRDLKCRSYFLIVTAHTTWFIKLFVRIYNVAYAFILVACTPVFISVLLYYTL